MDPPDPDPVLQRPRRGTPGSKVTVGGTGRMVQVQRIPKRRVSRSPKHKWPSCGLRGFDGSMGQVTDWAEAESLPLMLPLLPELTTWGVGR